jgi:hypothetical protein
MTMPGNANGREAPAFGRDEMQALIGGDLPERLVRHAATGARNKSSQRNNTHTGVVGSSKDLDIAHLTTAETAAWLLEQQKQKSGHGQYATTLLVATGGSASQPRHRTARLRNYHQLVLEEQQKAHTKQNQLQRSTKRQQRAV